MSLQDKVGQLFMVGIPLGKNHDVSMSAVVDRKVGNIFLQGRSTATQAELSRLVGEFTANEPAGLGMFVAVDQEGGYVQTLKGPEFSTMPTALDQAQAGLSEDTVKTWGSELAAAGVNLNLAPVADLVDIADPGTNAPIGYFSRQYTSDPATIEKSIGTFVDGMNAAGVGTTLKHFPGLGRVTGNTDTTAGVTDTVTTADGSPIKIFASGITHHPAMVMVSTAIYSAIDPQSPAAFSPTIVDGILRKNLGYDGVCITDDVSAAKQVEAWAPADRALSIINAGCDMVLVSADPSVAAAMVDAVVARAQSDPDFAKKVDAAATRIVAEKIDRGLQ